MNSLHTTHTNTWNDIGFAPRRVRPHIDFGGRTRHGAKPAATATNKCTTSNLLLNLHEHFSCAVSKSQIQLLFSRGVGTFQIIIDLIFPCRTAPFANWTEQVTVRKHRNAKRYAIIQFVPSLRTLFIPRAVIRIFGIIISVLFNRPVRNSSSHL